MRGITMYIRKLKICVQCRYQIGYQLLIEYTNIIGMAKPKISISVHLYILAPRLIPHVCMYVTKLILSIQLLLNNCDQRSYCHIS